MLSSRKMARSVAGGPLVVVSSCGHAESSGPDARRGVSMTPFAFPQANNCPSMVTITSAKARTSGRLF